MPGPLTSDRWMVADDMLAFHIESLQAMRSNSWRRQQLRREYTDLRRSTDRALHRDAKYDAETARLLAEHHERT